jgi:general secretion pathway protein I
MPAFINMMRLDPDSPGLNHRFLRTGFIGADGFTLLEVMVALGIAAIGLLALATALSRSVSVNQQIEVKTIANWVASNRFAELRMNRQFSSSGTAVSDEKLAGREWKIVDHYFSTADPNVVRVLIEVYELESEFPGTSNVGYLAKYKPPKP